MRIDEGRIAEVARQLYGFSLRPLISSPNFRDLDGYLYYYVLSGILYCVGERDWESCFMSRFNATWSNSAQWTDAVPEIFKQPMTIAFGGAVLAHAIFFLGLPVVAGKDNQPSIADTPLVEMRPQDMSQIPPDLTQSQIPTGTLLPSNGGLLTPSVLSPSMPPIDSGTPSTPGINFGSPSGPNVYSGGNLFGNSGSNSQSDSDNAAANARSAAAEKDRVKKEQAKQDEQRIANNPPNVKESVAPTEEQLKNQSKFPPGGATEQPTAAPSPTPTASPKISAEINAKMIASNLGFYTLDPKQTGPTLGLSLQQAIGSWFNKPDSKEKEIFSSSPKPPQQFQVDTPTKTIPYPTEVDKKPVAMIPDYAQKVGEKKETNGQAIVGIALDGQGKFVSEPSIIQSTGYAVLDAYAIEYVKSRVFRVTGRSGLYIMVIPIDPPVTKPVS